MNPSPLLIPRNLQILHPDKNERNATKAEPRCTAGTQSLLAVTFLCLVFAGVASAQEQARTFKIPFHSVNNLILLDAKVNGKPAALLLDTGAQFAMVDPHAIGLVVNLRAFELATRGARGEYVKHIAELDLGGFHWTLISFCQRLHGTDNRNNFVAASPLSSRMHRRCPLEIVRGYELDILPSATLALRGH